MIRLSDLFSKSEANRPEQTSLRALANALNCNEHMHTCSNRNIELSGHFALCSLPLHCVMSCSSPVVVMYTFITGTRPIHIFCACQWTEREALALQIARASLIAQAHFRSRALFGLWTRLAAVRTFGHLAIWTWVAPRVVRQVVN